MSDSRSKHTGTAIDTAEFTRFGKLLLALIFRVPVELREKIFFGKSDLCLILQKLLVRLLGGDFLVETCFIDGPMAGYRFQCWASEKYFLLGDKVENEAQQQLARVLRPGYVVYDVGGHIGYMSLLFSALVGSQGRVYVFEPSSINLPRIGHNIESNHRANIFVTQAAVSDRPGVVQLRECGSMSGVVTAASAEAGLDEITNVQAITLDDFVYQGHHPLPNLIKIDIEGYGGPALAGMKRILAEHQPIIVCELHNRDEQEHVTNQLAAHGYRIEMLDRGYSFPYRILASSQEQAQNGRRA